MQEFQERLLSLGYRGSGREKNLAVFRAFGEWLDREGKSLVDVDDYTAETFCASRKRRPRVAIRMILELLRERGAIPRGQQILDQWDREEKNYCTYLAEERGLSPKTIGLQTFHLRRFFSDLRESFVQPSQVLSKHVLSFVERRLDGLRADSFRQACGALRGFLQYLRRKRRCPEDFSFCVPQARRKRAVNLQFLSRKEVSCVLRLCDRQTAIGRRNRAILLLLARLGLRANEVATLTLDDVNWEAGLLTVHGKAGHDAMMPISNEVGSAIAAYLRNGRPASKSRRLFIHHRAPFGGFAGHTNVSAIASRTETLAGLNGISRKGAHLLRRSLATEMLRAGSSSGL
jgi:site-specific recombinase XerD